MAPSPARLAVVATALFAAAVPSAWAEMWLDMATISATSGVNTSRVCIGGGHGPDIACPTNAPFVDPASGRLGLGTTDPSRSLHVVPQAWGDGIKVASTGSGPYSVTVSSALAAAVVGVADGAAYSDIAAAGDVVFRGGAFAGAGANTILATRTVTGSTIFTTGFPDTEKMRITSAGNVGINTTNPKAKLEVAGAISATSFLINGVPIGGATPGGVSGSIQFNSGGVPAGRTDLVIDNVGRVGIATVNPATRLDVANGMRAVSSTHWVPSSGVGIETWYEGSLDLGRITAYDRGASQYKPLYIDGQNLLSTRRPFRAMSASAPPTPSPSSRSRDVAPLG